MAEKEVAEVRPNPPTTSFLQRLEAATYNKARELLGIPDKPSSEKLKILTPKQQEELRDIEAKAIASFKGDLPQLESALGMLRMGHHFGWKCLYMIHSKKTIRRYEEILGIEVRKIFKETGPSSYRSFGLAIAQKYTNFWKVAGGDIKIPRRNESSD